MGAGENIVPGAESENVTKLFVAIPPWTADGVLPPHDASSPVSNERSPYLVSLPDVVTRFGTSPQRQAILAGLLAYRRALHDAGLVRGFQWLDGSFAEHVEVIEQRGPNDIDVVTFYRLPSGATQETFAPVLGDLYDHDVVKHRFRVDAYFEDLAMEPELLVDTAAYWYSMWAHRRTAAWKGFLQIDLAPTHDAAARATLAHLQRAGGAP